MCLFWPGPHGEGSAQQLCAFFASGKVKKTWSKHVFRPYTQRGCHDNRGMQGMLDQFSHQPGSDLAAASSLPQILTELVDFPSFSN